MKRLTTFSILTLLALLADSSPNYAATADTLAKINALPKAERQKALEEGARKEGSVTVYGVLNADEHGPITAGFTKKYPFVSVDFLRGAAAKNFERAAMEKRAGKVRGDIFIGATLEMIIARREGIFAPYRSPEAQAYPGAFKDPDGYWISMGMGINVIAYNSSLLPEAEAPKGYPDLINPKWKGKIGIDLEI